MRAFSIVPGLIAQICVVSAISIQGIQHYAGSLFSQIDSHEATAVVTDHSPPWDCDIRAWTRAPDLYPGANLPAEARLAANGSACGDIIGWEAGLRYKERAVIMIRSVEYVLR